MAALEEGEAVAIFPQGRVRFDGPWLRGAARMALVTGAPILPVRLVDTGRALAPGTIGFPQLAALIGEPLEVEPREADDRALARADPRPSTLPSTRSAADLDIRRRAAANGPRCAEASPGPGRQAL